MSTTTTVPQSTSTTSPPEPSKIASTSPDNLSLGHTTLTQGLWRLPRPSAATDSLTSRDHSNKSSTRDNSSSEPPSRCAASLASTIGIKAHVPDISPHEFWNRILCMDDDGKEIVVVINGDLIRDRIRNKSLPWYVSLPRGVGVPIPRNPSFCNPPVTPDSGWFT